MQKTCVHNQRGRSSESEACDQVASWPSRKRGSTATFYGIALTDLAPLIAVVMAHSGIVD